VSLRSSFFEAGQLGVVMADEGQIVLQGELADRVRLRREELFAPGLPVVKRLAAGGPVVSQLMDWMPGEQFAAVPDVEQPLAQQGAQGAFLGGINIGRGNQVGAQQVAEFFRVNAVVLVFAP